MANFPTTLDDNNSLYALVNQAKTYLDGTMGTTGGNNNQANSLDVESGTNFPTTGGFILIGTELIKYTTRSSNKLTGLTRAYGGSTAAIHRDGAVVKMVVMAEYHNANKDAIIAIETALGALLANVVKRYVQSTDPILTNTLQKGDIWVDTSTPIDHDMYMYNGTAWILIGA